MLFKVDEAAMTAQEAREITEAINRTGDQLWRLIYEAHTRFAHKALGYKTWGAYVEVEFRLTREHSYKLLQQGQVIYRLMAATGSEDAIVPESTARALHPEIEAIVAEIEERRERGEDPKAVLGDVLQRKRDEQVEIARQKREERARRKLEADLKEIAGERPAGNEVAVVEAVKPEEALHILEEIRAALGVERPHDILPALELLLGR